MVLDIDYKRILVPNRVTCFVEDQSVTNIVASDPAENIFDITPLNTSPLFLDYFQSLHQILVLLHDFADLLIRHLFALFGLLEFVVYRIDGDFGLLQQSLKFFAIAQ